jgi:3-oxoacyl-[acyl-carrier protein] reductase
MTVDTRGLLAGRVAIVTGSAHGIGLAVTTALAEVGAHVAMLDFDREQNASSAATLHEQGLTVRPYGVDVGDRASVESTIAEVCSDLGTPRILVNNAGITRPAMLYRMTDEDWDTVLRVNLSAAFYTIRGVSRLMIDASAGSIINVSALSGLRGAMGQINYVSAKAGLLGMTKAAALELARYGIRVNAVTPGVISTRMSEKILTDERFREKYIGEIPLARVGEPVDIARVIRFLASDESSYMTGQVLNVSGGGYM